MPAITTTKGLIGETAVMSDLVRQGHEVAIPLGHNLPFDLIVIRKEDGRLEKVQVKYNTPKDGVVTAFIRSSSAWVQHNYTPGEVDWMAVYDATHERCYYIPSRVWEGRNSIHLRFAPTRNGQVKGIRWAQDFTQLEGFPREPVPPGRGSPVSLPFTSTPE